MMGQSHSGTNNIQRSKRELLHAAIARKAAAEGMVLLKNENVLPLKMPMSIALLGGGAAKTVKGGTGSGDVNNRESISIYEGLKTAGAAITSEDWIADYENRYKAARQVWKEKILEDVKHVENPFDAYAANSFSLPDGRKITVEDLKDAKAAVYVISRIAGEGKDRRKEEGDYYLSAKEREDLFYLNQTGLPIILLLNVGAPIELTDILQEAENIKAVLNISLPGQEGGHAVADVLFGYVTPGGRLTATWAKRYEEYPSAEQFGYLNGNLETEVYGEGIFVGYRHFDKFGIKPLFPFGYGLSYTTFSIKFEEARRTEKGIDIIVLVENTGGIYSGREVVQVYAALPQTAYEKEYQRLVGFAKTGILKPGEKQKLTISIEQMFLASYSEDRHAWLIEAGTYGIWVGSHIASLQLVEQFIVPRQTVLEQTKKLDSEDVALTREQSITELIPLLYGNITGGNSMLGSAGVRVPGSAGETTEALEKKYGIRSLIMADGPAGLRIRQSYEVDRETDFVYSVGVLGSLENGFLEDAGHHENADTYYQFCTAFPVGTAFSQSWDMDLLREFGKAIAVEMEEFHVDLWLAPGMNIQRNPLCGRNFEYYSEDPFLSGMMAAAVTEGVQSRKGCGVTIKHFACNNQEDNRMGVNACVSERALREIYLRGFEIAIKKSAPAAMMSSYNLINGVHAANNKDICTNIAREEWGFEGVIMSDWHTTAPQDGSVPWKCVEAGNDIIMPGSYKDDENIRKAYEEGKLSEEVIRRSAGRVIRMVQNFSCS